MAGRFRFPLRAEEVDPAFVALLERIERDSVLLDARYRIPGTSITFGLDPLIGIVPLLGDMVATAWSLRLLAMAHQLGADPQTMRRMLANIAVDFLIGLVPVIGPIADTFYRANARNYLLLLQAIGRASGRPDAIPVNEPGDTGQPPASKSIP